MTGPELIVLMVGVTLIALVNWYFFFAGRSAVAATSRGSGPDEVMITIHGSYDPSVVRARAGRPLRLIFDRQETASCSEEIVIPAFGIRRFLPPFKRTAIEITPERAGTFPFMCGMSMLHGTIVAE
jgi:plastocyanin domain-containing protein